MPCSLGTPAVLRVPAAPAGSRLSRSRLRVSTAKSAFARPVRCDAGENGWPTAFRSETSKLVAALITRQAVKTALVYFEETNGQNHLYLHQFLVDNPIKVDSFGAADEWLVKLACTPITKIQDPRRSSVVTAATLAAVTNGEREISPRDIAERIMALRIEIARELGYDTQPEKVRSGNQEMLRKALTCMVTAKPNLPRL